MVIKQTGISERISLLYFTSVYFFKITFVRYVNNFYICDYDVQAFWTK